jgi:hypothetical protein
MSETITIDDIAREMDRLCPSQVDRTPCDYGVGYESGHDAHSHDSLPHREAGNPLNTIGWFCGAGNAGNPVLSIAPENVPTLYRRLAALPDGALDDAAIADHDVFLGLDIEWHV